MIEELERRLLFSADVPLLVDPNLADPDALDSPAAHMDLLQDEAAATAAITERREIVFVDAGADAGDALLDDLRASGRWVDVVLLDGERDGIEQITAALHGHAELDAIHIVSHGTEGAVQLGSTWLDGSSLETQASAIASWGDALANDADLLFYGCDLASDGGAAFVDSMADLTGADVAASTDPTGAATLGGDWELEYAAGGIETQVAFGAELQQSWAQVLAVGTGDISTGTGNGSSVSFSHDVSGSDRVLMVGVSMSNPGARTVSSITYDGQALSFVGSENNSNDKSRIEIWSLVAPNTGTNNLVVTLSGANGDGFVVGAMTFTGVDQDTPLGTFSSASGHSAGGSTVVSSAAGELVFSTLNIQTTANDDLIPGAGQTEHWDLHQNRADGGGSTAPGAASVTMSWSFGKDEWALGAVSIKPVLNDAPVLTPVSPDLTPITEDETGNGGDLISAIVGTSISDGDGDPEGIAITGLSPGGGTWQYDTGSGWADVGTVSSNQSLLLRDTDSIRFVPDGQNGESPDPTFTYRAWDRTTGAVGTKVDTTSNGGSTAFSSSTDTASIAVSSVNDAPTVLSLAPTAIDENVARWAASAPPIRIPATPSPTAWWPARATPTTAPSASWAMSCGSAPRRTSRPSRATPSGFAPLTRAGSAPSRPSR
jgi:hypothetical protein